MSTVDEYEEICYMCRRPESVAGKMIKIQPNVCICRDCMQKTFDSMNNMPFGGEIFGMPGMGFTPDSVPDADFKELEGGEEKPDSEKKTEEITFSNPKKIFFV